MSGTAARIALSAFREDIAASVLPYAVSSGAVTSRAPKLPILRVYGLWIVRAAAPDNAAGDTGPEIDIPGNDLPLRLWIALRPQGLQDAFAYCAENMQSPHFGKLDAYKLGQGSFRLKAALRSATFKQDFWFTLLNDPSKDQLELTADDADVEFLLMP